MEREDEERFREWLDLDQADQDIGLHYEGLTTNSLDDPFQSAIFNYPSSIHPQQQQTTQTTDTQPFTQLHLPITHPELHLDRATPISSTPTYALDPSLISASVPSQNLGGSVQNSHALLERPNMHHINPPISTITLPWPPASSHVPLKKEDGHVPLKKEHGIGHDDEDEDELSTGMFDTDHKINRNNHSRSSSAILFPAATPSRSHKRTLSHSHPLINVPDWQDKPSAEEYKMLSSKEKRQLRNKISARNFRHRRKQHISTLEQQLAQRDEAIESLNHDLGQVRLENKELKSQVEVLKQKWSDLMKKIEEMSLNSASTTLPSPTLSSTTTGCPSSSAFLNPASPRSRSAKTNGMIPLPNLHKDLGSHTRKPFNGVGGMTSGGNVGVHTTLIPEVMVDVYEEPVLIRSNDSTRSNVLSPQCDLSPQAMIELKLRHQKMINPTEATNNVLEKQLGSNPTGDFHDTHKNRSMESPVTMSQSLENYGVMMAQENETDMRERLMRMVFETLEVERSDLSSDPLCAPHSIDSEKLKACLEGRLVFKLVELSPPPYCLASSDKTKSVTAIPTPCDGSLSSTVTATGNLDPAFHLRSSGNVVGLSDQFSDFKI